MVDISYRCQITYQEEKPVSIAADLVEEHQGQKFLKISATNYAICQLVCGGKLPTKNTSLAKSKELQTLVQARNDKIQELLAAPEEDTQEGQELFDSEMPANKGTKKEKPKPWKQQVTSLWSPSYWDPLRFHVWLVAKRPTKWDLFVAMEPEPLREVICHLKAGCQQKDKLQPRIAKAIVWPKKHKEQPSQKSTHGHCYNNHQSKKNHYQSTVSIDTPYGLMFLNGAAVFTN